MMDRSDRIFVAGHGGLVGSAIVRRLESAGYRNLVLKTRGELDLRRQSDVEAFFHAERPASVFLAAAKVGGIGANAAYPADFLRENLSIALNVIEAAHRSGTRDVLNLGSSCIYPRMAPQPIREDYLLSGPLEATNEAYAIAKIAAIKLCRYFNAQYGTRYISAMPANLYGPGDNYDPGTSHVLPAMIRKFHEGKLRGTDVTLWGDGTARREFLHSDDLADAVVFLMERNSGDPPEEIVNIGSGYDMTIARLAELVSGVVGFTGRILWDRSKPNGTPRKLLDVGRMRSLGWEASIDLERGIRDTYADFLSRFGAEYRHVGDSVTSMLSSEDER